MIELYADGAARGNPGHSGIGFIIKDNKRVLSKGSYYIGEHTNNEAEYYALIKALEEAVKIKVNKIKIFSDSELIVSQINGSYKIKNEKLKQLYNRVRSFLFKFDKYFVQLIPREKNHEADSLANKGIDDFESGETKEYKFSGINHQNKLF